MAMTAKMRRYRGEAYWEREKPLEAWTERAALSYYPQAGKLQVALTYKDRETGERRRGKVVTLDQEDLITHPEALRLLERVLREWT